MTRWMPASGLVYQSVHIIACDCLVLLVTCSSPLGLSMFQGQAKLTAKKKKVLSDLWEAAEIGNSGAPGLGIGNASNSFKAPHSRSCRNLGRSCKPDRTFSFAVKLSFWRNQVQFSSGQSELEPSIILLLPQILVIVKTSIYVLG